MVARSVVNLALKLEAYESLGEWMVAQMLVHRRLVQELVLRSVVKFWGNSSDVFCTHSRPFPSCIGSCSISCRRLDATPSRRHVGGVRIRFCIFSFSFFS